MENPETWGQAERVITEAYGQYHTDRDRGVIGLSLARTIADALRGAGLLRERNNGRVASVLDL